MLLVNPNGIEITKSGLINTGSFAASTMNIKDSDYLSGKYSFSGNGASSGVINNGRINVADGGFAALLGGQVSNNGVISARLGFVALGAGEMATLDLSGDGFLSVAVPSSQLGKLVSANGALVSNKEKSITPTAARYSLCPPPPRPTFCATPSIQAASFAPIRSVPTTARSSSMAAAVR